MATNLSGDTILDPRGTPIVIGSRVRPSDDSGIRKVDPGTVIWITDFEGDVDDDTRQHIDIFPYIHVRWSDSIVDTFATNGWTETTVAWAGDGSVLEAEYSGICEELIVDKDYPTA